MFTVKIPKVGIVTADTIEALGEAAWRQVHGGNREREYYGCSDVGTDWPVREGNRLIGTLRYNGKFDRTPETVAPREASATMNGTTRRLAGLALVLTALGLMSLPVGFVGAQIGQLAQLVGSL